MNLLKLFGMEKINELSNIKLLAEVMKKHEKDEHVQELIKRFDMALGGLEQPNLYYKSDVDAFVNGKSPALKKANS